MSLFEDAMQIAVQLPIAERERLGRALGLSVHTKTPGKTLPTGTLPLNAFVSNPAQDPSQSADWRQRERGHAVVDTGEAIEEIADGPRALFGLLSEENHIEYSDSAPLASSLPSGTPTVVHVDTCWSLAIGNEQALQFFNAAPVEVRLATATYLALLESADTIEEVARVQTFVQPYAVLSLGPMASSRAVELMTSEHRHERFTLVDALSCSTALAHEIPFVTLDAERFSWINELQVVRPF
jgi:predicted nucleic acid-binding protein